MSGGTETADTDGVGVRVPNARVRARRSQSWTEGLLRDLQEGMLVVSALLPMFSLTLPKWVFDFLFWFGTLLFVFSLIRAVWLMREMRKCVMEMHNIAAQVAELHAQFAATEPERDMALRIARDFRVLGQITRKQPDPDRGIGI
jgi:hypothetical protein